jgi:circadian clock protein KaiB
VRIRLYVAGQAPNSLAALANVRAALAGLPERRVDLEIIDVLEDPERGLRDGIFMTPMFIRIAPLPERRILGNLSARATLLDTLAPGEPLDE